MIGCYYKVHNYDLWYDYGVAAAILLLSCYHACMYMVQGT